VPPHLCRLFRWCETDSVWSTTSPLCTTEQTATAPSDIIVLMTTNLTISAEAKAESDQRWAQWIAVGARRDRERQKRAKTFTIVIAIVLAIWLAKLLVLG
jgi:hypothetical protein